MTHIEKTRVYVIVLGVTSLVFSIVNPSLNIPILVAFAWYAYVWNRDYQRTTPLPWFYVYCIMGVIGFIVVTVRTILFNI